MSEQVLRIPLRVVFYREDDRIIAHCLEFNLIGDGETHQESLDCLEEAIMIQVEASREFDNLNNLFNPAGGETMRMFAAGEDIATGSINFHLLESDDVQIEGISARQYPALDAPNGGFSIPLPA